MPTTPKGNSWTTGSANLPGIGVTHWAHPDEANDAKYVIYMHGAGGGPDQFTAIGAWAGMRNWLIDNGWGWVECAGGGLQPWGNPASELIYANLMDYADEQFNVSTWIVLGRSMGGIVATRLYLARRGDPRVRGLIVNSGVQDILWAYDSNQWQQAMHSAWGVTDRAGLVDAVAGLNPVDGPAPMWNDASVLQLWGTADGVVPSEPNAQAMRAMYSGRPRRDEHEIREGGDHSTGNGSYAQVSAMARFIQETTARPDFGYRVKDMYFGGPDGRLYRTRPV